MTITQLNRSPFFYVGDKYKLLPQLVPSFPQDIDKFVEPFVGGGSVFLNVSANKYALNDIDQNIIKIHKYLVSQSKKPDQFFRAAFSIIEDHGLSRSCKEDIVPAKIKSHWKKTYYAKFNKNGYGLLRTHFNAESRRDPLAMYLLLIYGFNRMLRFNSAGRFNLPVGNVDFNRNVEEALKNYFSFVADKEITFSNSDYRSFLHELSLGSKDFVYLDPPYLISFSEYNKLWNSDNEAELLSEIDVLNNAGIKFALSNVTHYRGRKNLLLIRWMKKYRSLPVKSNYISYHDNSVKKSTEVLITNY